MKPRLLFVSNLFPDAEEPYRGLDNATVLHALRPFYEIRVVSPRPWLPGGWQEKRCRPGDEVFAPHYVKAPYLPKIGGLANDRLMAAALHGPLRDLKRTFDWERVLTSWLFPDGSAMHRCLGEGLRQVLIAQGSDVHVYLHSPARRRAILRALAAARGCITRSASLAALLASAGADSNRLRPVCNGVDTVQFRLSKGVEERLALGVDPDATVLLFVGNLLPVKDPLKMVRCMAALRQRLPGRALKLVMIGKGPLRTAVEAEIEALGIGDCVRMTGPLPAAAVAQWMRASEALCLTSRNEGLPNVVLEAQACGLPILATDVGGISEVVDAPWKGALANPDDEAEWIGKAVQALQAKGLSDRERISVIGGSRTWTAAAATYRDVLEGQD